MCFIISIILLILSYNFFIAGNIAVAVLCIAVSMFFIYLMIKNIKHVKKLREEKNDN